MSSEQAVNWQQYAQYGACLQLALAVLYFWTGSFLLGVISIAFAVVGVCGVLTGVQRWTVAYLGFVVAMLAYEIWQCIPFFIKVS